MMVECIWGRFSYLMQWVFFVLSILFSFEGFNVHHSLSFTFIALTARSHPTSFTQRWCLILEWTICLNDGDEFTGAWRTIALAVPKNWRIEPIAGHILKKKFFFLLIFYIWEREWANKTNEKEWVDYYSCTKNLSISNSRFRNIFPPFVCANHSHCAEWVIPIFVFLSFFLLFFVRYLLLLRFRYSFFHPETHTTQKTKSFRMWIAASGKIVFLLCICTTKIFSSSLCIFSIWCRLFVCVCIIWIYAFI